mgnify:CR=1 FL=1
MIKILRMLTSIAREYRTARSNILVVLGAFITLFPLIYFLTESVLAASTISCAGILFAYVISWGTLWLCNTCHIELKNTP